MKNFNEFQLIGIGIALLLTCIIFSLMGKHIFGLDGDYLSAAATLFASVIAFILFNDWRDEQEHQVFTELIKTIKQDYRKLNDKYIEDLYSLHEMLHKLKFNHPTQALTFEVIEKITLSYTTFSRVFKEIQISLLEIKEIKSDFNNFDEMYKKITDYEDELYNSYQNVCNEIQKISDTNNYEETIYKLKNFRDLENDLVGKLYVEIVFSLIGKLSAKG
ncbi:hypothetical protein NRA66_12680 [Acinetobacter baumannii]|uniref:hypothetical protein n=1 Tax=Acinetobacter baumannii TaxID=470 RepID=UPI00233F1F47|nr:hypothetical protein [Acinetobacter baumannii]MDC4659471.1 hypothetical protein [Acinetobacter baumannii]MDC5550309.1 hypothetical protein [Acinetobacter baumannii]MDC5572171.1 hypothetical protein [Acinetobacter baumannii]MDV5174760.1 hypothetical protein [Acinetobacter baumannii]